jgi:Pentapeptide repeats (9 copies)
MSDENVRPPESASENAESLQAEVHERIRKLQLENRLLEIQTSKDGQKIERVKAYTSIGGLITAAVAALAFLASLYQISENYRRSDASLKAERFGKALTLLSESRPAQRLTGVTYMASILPDDLYYRREAGDTLANMLGLEDDVVVRRSIRDALVDYANSAITEEQDRNRLQRVLVQLSKTIALEKMDFLSTQEDSCNPPKLNAPETCETKERLDAVASVLQALVRKGSTNKNLAGIYCSYCEFSNLKLEGFDFTGAILNEATFSAASLKGASFKNASLIQTKFENSNLQRADFSIRGSENYVKRRFRITHGDDTKYGPDFTCADLSGARFSMHPVFRVHSSLQQKFFADMGPIFWWSNLDGAGFSSSLAYGVTNQREGPFKVTTYGFEIPTANGFHYAEWMLEPDSFLQIDETSPYWAYLNIEFGIINAHWEKAKWPKGIRVLLERAKQKPLEPPPKWYGGSTSLPPELAPKNCIGLRR